MERDVRSRRDRHEIIMEILESAKGGAKKTHIMYKAKLSYYQVNEYLTLLINKGFLEDLTIAKRKQLEHLLKTSELGEEFIHNFRKLNV